MIQDAFWFCICWYFKPGKHLDVETRLFDRISANFVGLFSSLNPSRKDFFFRCYADAVAQAVLYAMFLAYPKSRIDFTDKFRKDLVIRISYWTSGICPEFVDTSHWKLNLGGGDVLQAAPSQPHQRNVEATGPMTLRATATQPLLGQLSADSLADRTAWMGHWNRRPRRKLQYSPLVENFLRARKYSSVNLVRATSMHMTTAEQRAKKMDVKHAMLAERATAARERCDKLCNEYAPCLLFDRLRARVHPKRIAVGVTGLFLQLLPVVDFSLLLRMSWRLKFESRSGSGRCRRRQPRSGLRSAERKCCDRIRNLPQDTLSSVSQPSQQTAPPAVKKPLRHWSTWCSTSDSASVCSWCWRRTPSRCF